MCACVAPTPHLSERDIAAWNRFGQLRLFYAAIIVWRGDLFVNPAQSGGPGRDGPVRGRNRLGRVFLRSKGIRKTPKVHS